MGRGPAVPIPLIASRSIHEVRASRSDERDRPTLTEPGPVSERRSGIILRIAPATN